MRETEESDEVPSPEENLRLPVIDLLVALMSELKFIRGMTICVMGDRREAFRRALKYFFY